MIYYLNSLPSGGGEQKYIANFDFTQSLTDSVNGFTAVLSNCTRDSSGVHLSGYTSYVSITQLLGILTTPVFTIEVDFGDCNPVVSSDHKRLVMWTEACGFIYRSAGYWAIYNANNWYGQGNSNIDIIDNSTLKIKFHFDHKIEAYVNDTLIYSYNDIRALTTPTSLYIGSKGFSYYDLYVKALRVYYD